MFWDYVYFFGVARENEINEAGRWLFACNWTYLKCLLVVFILIKIDESKLVDFIARNRSVTFFSAR